MTLKNFSQMKTGVLLGFGKNIRCYLSQNKMKTNFDIKNIYPKCGN